MEENIVEADGVTRREAIHMGAVAVLGAALAAAMPAVGNVEVAEAKSAWVPEFCGRGEFAKYGKLADKQVRKLAALCYIEGGDANGAADVASIMANRYELYGKKKYKNLYKYVRSSGWWFLASEMDEEKAPAKVIAVVSAVLKDGKRTLPGFIDEYDRLGDIKSLSNGKSPMKRKSYSKGVKVRNAYGSTWRFWAFVGGDADACGYTAKAKRKRPATECYRLANG